MTRADIQALLRDHVRYHAELEPPTREQQLRGEAKVVTEYRGRVLVELFQNAVDRAEHRVMLRLHDRTLAVANDNPAGPLSIYPLDHAATQGRLDRSDFHALCSMDTSRKQAWQAIGNKGIGFKSVFREAHAAQIWSRHQDHWWGFRLVHPFTRVDAERIAASPPPDEQVWPDWSATWTAIAGSLRGVPAPSFYFPEPLRRAPLQATDPWVTVVLLELRDEHSLHGQQQAFTEMPLHFVSARYPEKRGVRIEVGEHERSIDFVDDWTAVPPRPRVRPDLVDAARREDLSFTKEHPPAVQLAVPPPGRAHTPRFHCFFPTQVTSGFGVDVHADFLVDPSRKSLEFLDDGKRPGYNAALLDTAADLLVQALQTDLYQRSDLWRFVTPGNGAHPAFVARVRERLLGYSIKDPAPWVALCTRAFGHIAERGAPWAFYEGFWKTVEAWWPHRGGGPRNYETYRNKILGPLLDLPLIPLSHGAPEPGRLYRGVPGPKTGQRTVLLRRPDERSKDSSTPLKRPDLPQELLQRVAVTGAFPLADARFWAGLQDFSWASLVAPARDWILTIDSRSPRWSPDDEVTRDAVQQRIQESADPDAVLRALYALALEAEGAPRPAAERLMARARDRISGGEVDRAATQLRAESALPLPVHGGHFLPACRVVIQDHALKVANGVDWGVLDRGRLLELGVADEDHERLARRLGCFDVVPLSSRADQVGLHLPFDPLDLDPADWSALLEAWEPWFRNPEGAPFAASLRASPWFPVQGGTPPDQVWQIAPSDPLRYPPLPMARRPPSELLSALGIRHLPATEAPFDDSLDTKASASLVRLAADALSLARPREARQVFVRLTRGLAPQGTQVPALASSGKGQPLTWLDPDHGQVLYLVSRERRGLTRHFPGLLLVAAEAGGERAARFGARPFDPTVELFPPGPHPPADDIKHRLEGAVPWLLTLAEGRRLGVRRSPEEVAAAWNLAAVRRCGNAYLRLSLEGSGDVEVGHLDEQGQPILNNAFLADDRAVLCDVVDPDDAAATWLPRFAPWYALTVFANEQLEGAFRSLLAALGRDWDEQSDHHGRAHLALHDLDPERVDEMRSDFLAACWSPEERQARIDSRTAALSQFGVVSEGADLLSPYLGPEVWLPEGRAAVTQTEVDDALALAEPIHGVRFSCQRTHEVWWTRRKPTLKTKVLQAHILLRGVGSWTDEQVAELHEAWADWSPKEALLRIDFDPTRSAVERFPGREAKDEEERARAQAVLQRRPYAAMEDVPVGLRTVTPRRAGTGLVQSAQQRKDRAQRQGLRGRNAEQARAQEAARNVALASEDLRGRIDAERQALRSELRAVPAACLAPIAWAVDPDLVAAVHVAAQVDCGYDVLDIHGGELLRVEVKSHTGAEQGEVQVHLSANELRRALQTHEEPGVRYRLEVYLGYGRRVDATQALNQALTAPWLREILTTSVAAMPESFILTLSVPPRS